MLAWQLYEHGQWTWTRIAKKRYIFMIFLGGPDPLSPSGSAHAKGRGEWHIVNNNGILSILIAIKPIIVDAPAIFQLGRGGMYT